MLITARSPGPEPPPASQRIATWPQFVHPAAGIGVTLAPLPGSRTALIAMTNLLTATDVGLRDHVPEAGILEAMGLTPRQVMATLVVSTTIVTAIGVVAGVVAGLAAASWPISAQGHASGLGWGIAAGLPPQTIAAGLPPQTIAAGLPPQTIAALVCAALAVAVAAALFLARRATRAQHSLLAARPPASRLTRA